MVYICIYSIDAVVLMMVIMMMVALEVGEGSARDAHVVAVPFTPHLLPGYWQLNPGCLLLRNRRVKLANRTNWAANWATVSLVQSTVVLALSE